MKQIKKIFHLFAAITLILGSCTKADNFMDDVVEGGLLEVMTPSINYVVGNTGPYNLELRLLQSASLKTNKVDAYVVFHSHKRNKDGSIFLDAKKKKVPISSNEKLIYSTAINTEVTHFQKFTIDFASLVSDLSVEGNDFYSALPDNDGEYLIGDYWEIKFRNTLSDGSVHENDKRVDIAVSTRFAGTYVCTEMAYFRIGVKFPSYWLGKELIIKSVDAITYEYVWGVTIGWEGPLFFQIDPATNKITYPEKWDGTVQKLNSNPITTPNRNASNLTNVIPLAGTDINLAITDDKEGKDKLVMVYGYFTTGSGPREFYDVLVKKVN